MTVARFVLIALAPLIACAEPGTSGPGDLDDGQSTSPDTRTEADTHADTDTRTEADTHDAQTEVDPTDPCAVNPCADPHAVCVPDGSDRTCFCDVGYVQDGGVCVANTCDDERIRTHLTVHDLTPLPGITNPVRTGFDPLLGGDRVRVMIELDRRQGTRALRVSVFTQRLEIDPTSLRLDGGDTDATSNGRQVTLTLPATFTFGRLSFEATVTATGTPAVGLDARVSTELGCPISGSGSGARLHLAGTRDPKSPGCVDMADVRSLQLTDAIPDKDTTVYTQRNGTFDAISSTYKVLTQMTICLERGDPRTVSLAGSADGTRPWTIDNFLLIERFTTDPELGPTTPDAAWLTTSTNTSAPGRYANGTPITIIKHASLPGDLTGSRTPSAFSFPANVLQLDALLPVGQRTWLRFTGLDTGVAGHLSRLFIVSHDLDAEVPECRSHLDCPRTDATNGSAIAIRSGCISGRCIATPCGAGCPLGQRCLQDFCTDGCTADAGCPSGTTCSLGRCVAPTPGTPGGQCRAFSDCPLGEVCLFGRCEPGCFHPVNQNPAYTDNHSASLCAINRAACPRCPEATDRCWYGYCRQCEIDAHCATGQRCADTRCVAR